METNINWYSPLHGILRRDLPKVCLDDIAILLDIQSVRVAAGAPVVLAMSLEGGINRSWRTLLDRRSEDSRRCQQRKKERGSSRHREDVQQGQLLLDGA